MYKFEDILKMVYWRHCNLYVEYLIFLKCTFYFMSFYMDFPDENNYVKALCSTMMFFSGSSIILAHRIRLRRSFLFYFLTDYYLFAHHSSFFGGNWRVSVFELQLQEDQVVGHYLVIFIGCKIQKTWISSWISFDPARYN